MYIMYIYICIDMCTDMYVCDSYYNNLVKLAEEPANSLPGSSALPEMLQSLETETFEVRGRMSKPVRLF